ncbi:MAG: cupin domain-containing protein [Acidobacteria bacterium]|nr:cupin domain-containing protein [Acidobacteriota bacterium]
MRVGIPIGVTPGAIRYPGKMIIRNPAAHAQFSNEKMGKVTLAGGQFLYSGLNCFEPGQEHKAHTHTDQDKLYVVLQGSGEASVGEETSQVTQGDVIFAPAGVLHSMRNPGPGRLVVMIVFAPPPKK